jgi:ATP-dependent RNA helicase SUPV3L1/SUV3
LVFDSQLRVCWGGGPVARLLPSGDVLAPKVEHWHRICSTVRRARTCASGASLGRNAYSPRPQRIDGCPRHGRAAGRLARRHLPALREVSAFWRVGPIEDQLAQLGEEDRKALARLGVSVGVYSLYFPSMLKPVPIRLRAGLWMVARNRETIPPLPAEGRTSMDLPPSAEREFYATIGYLPLGNHAIRADMVERLAAMAASRRARKSRSGASGTTAAAEEARGKAPEQRRRAAAAAALGRRDQRMGDRRRGLRRDSRARAANRREAAGAEAGDAGRGEHRPMSAEPTSAAAETADRSDRRGAPRAPAEAAAEADVGRRPAEQPHAPTKPKADEPEDGPRPLPPGWFRATPQMMSLVGCSEPEMADVLRALGYRVHPPSERHGPLHAFSVKPRFVREREEQRERQRLQQREQRDQRRRDGRAAQRAAVLRRRAAPRPRKDGAADGRPDGPPDGRRTAAPTAPREDAARASAAAPRPPRRDSGGRRCGSTPRPRRRATRRRFAVRQAARAEARRKEVAAVRPQRCDAARQVAVARALLQDPHACRALMSRSALPDRWPRVPTSRMRPWPRAWCLPSRWDRVCTSCASWRWVNVGTGARGPRVV